MSQQTRVVGRVVVASPELRRRWAVRQRPVVHGQGGQSGVSAVQVRALMRAQLRVAFGTGLIVLAVVGGLPLVFACFPVIAQTRVAGVPVPWLVLGLCIQPVWILAARRHLRRAERVERDFAELVARS